MKKRYVALGVLGLLVAGVGTAAYVAAPTVHEGAVGEAPELGRQGAFAIGTFTKNFVLPDRARITGTSVVTGSLDGYERSLKVRFWYPAQAAGQQDGGVTYQHLMQVPGREPVTVSTRGFASETAQPIAGEHFPFVLMSHGFRGWDTQFSALAEHIASHGYIVASIDHADAPADGVAGFLLSFANVLVDRTLDQRQTLTAILELSRSGKEPRLSALDSEKVGLIGYSMGGYGALATAGAAYEFSTDPMAKLPEAARQRLSQATATSADIDALVAFSPWGGQPDNRAWSTESLAKISIPTMIVAGNQDDVVNYADGITWLFDNLSGTDRQLLVFREARHNIVGNNFDMPADSDFQAIEYLKEPVWRSERLNAINQHFVTAFLDWHLKGEADKAGYFDLPTTSSDDGRWDIDFGEQLNGTMAGPEQDQYWRGFQRRWALGLEMYHADAGTTGSLSGEKATPDR